MDYCYTCQRTLNGALVCPGCGACAPEADIPRRNSFAGGPIPPSSRAGAVLQELDAALEPAGRAWEPQAAAAPLPLPEPAPAGGESGEQESVLGPASIAPTLHRGRAARRRQMARWKKSRRRAGVATAFALFGGGVTLAAVHTAGRGGPASASSYDTVTPVSLQDGGSGTQAGNDTAPTGNTGSAHNAPSVPKQRGAHARPAAQTSHPSTDSAASSPLTGTTTATTSHARRAPQTSTTQAPSQTTATGSTSTSAASTSTGGGDQSSGTTAGSGTSTGTGGSTSATPPATSDPTTPPATTDPGSTSGQHGLCVLVLCID
jgi:hypothetical protein